MVEINRQVGDVSGMYSPSSRTIVELLRQRADDHPDRLAYSFISPGDEETNISYGQLDCRARAIAAHLLSRRLQGQRVLLLFPPGLDFITAFFGALYCGAAAVPIAPPARNPRSATFRRTLAVSQDAGTKFVLTCSALAERWLQASDHERELLEFELLAIDDISIDAADHWTAPDTASSDLAVLQYTSGSTGSPKGVMLCHENLLHNSAIIQRAFQSCENSQGVIWLPPYHDMGLVGGILQPLFAGFPVALSSPAHFVMSPLRWLQTISTKQATISGGPNFAYDLCVQRVKPEQLSALDLSSWNVAFVGAEPVRHEVLNRFAQTFAPCGFRREAFLPCYGLAEATLYVTGTEMSVVPRTRTCSEQGSSRQLVSCGQSPSDQTVIIVDPETRTPCPEGTSGEIWVSGPSVALGYWDRPRETEETFRASLADGSDMRFLRTGDLGFIADGDLYVTGRIKDLIIIGGVNHRPEDIEQTIEQSHPAIRPNSCAAFSFEIDGEDRVSVAVEFDPMRTAPVPGNGVDRDLTQTTDDIMKAIRRGVSEQHGLRVESVFMLKPNRIPRTTSGKIQRHRCRELFLANRVEAR